MNSSGTKYIYLDMDGVLTDWMGHVTTLFQIPADFYFQPGCWDTVPAMLDYLKIHSSEYWKRQSPEFWATMPWTDYGQELLACCEANIGIDYCRVLSTPANGDSASGKLWWLEYNMPYYIDKRNYHLTKHKHEIAGPNKLLLDDNDSNIRDWRMHGGKAILIPTKYNSKHMDLGIDSVKDEIRNFVNSREPE